METTLTNAIDIRKKLEETYVNHLKDLKKPVPIPPDAEISKLTGRELVRRTMAGIRNDGELGDPFLPEGPYWPDLAVPIMAMQLRIDLENAVSEHPGICEVLELVVRSNRQLETND